MFAVCKTRRRQKKNRIKKGACASHVLRRRRQRASPTAHSRPPKRQKRPRANTERAKRGEPVECRARGVVHKHENPRPPDRQARKGGRRPELHRGPRMLQVIFSFFPEGRESFALMSRCRADPPPTTGAQRQGPRSNSGRGKGLQASAALTGLRRPVKITRALSRRRGGLGRHCFVSINTAVATRTNEFSRQGPTNIKHEAMRGQACR